MAYRKILFAVDCANEQEKEYMQQIATELSNSGMLKASDIINMYPLFKKKAPELISLFKLIAQGGPKALLSAQGMGIIAKLSKH